MFIMLSCGTETSSSPRGLNMIKHMTITQNQFLLLFKCVFTSASVARRVFCLWKTFSLMGLNLALNVNPPRKPQTVRNVVQV